MIPFPDEKIAEIDAIFSEYIWNGKTHKVKKFLMTQEYKYGGHKMTDLESVLIVQKLKWISRYLDHHSCFWRHTMEALIGVENLNIFLRSNFNIKDFKTITPFYKEVLQALCSARYIDNITSEGISNQFIYYNENIKINGNYVYDKKLMEAGVWTVRDLFDINLNLLPFEVLRNRGVQTNFYLTWRGIVELVIKKWKGKIAINRVKHLNEIRIKNNEECLTLSKLNARNLYDILVHKKIPLSKAKQSYCDYFNIDNTVEHWSTIYTMPRQVMYDNKIKEMQFKILHKYFPTNLLLYKMKKVNSHSCSFCFMYAEDMFHLFYNCHQVRPLWFFIENLCMEKLNIDITFKCQDIILGYDLSRMHEKYIVIVNKVILYCKYYITQCKYAGVQPTNNAFKQSLKYHTLLDKEMELML